MSDAQMGNSTGTGPSGNSTASAGQNPPATPSSFCCWG